MNITLKKSGKRKRASKKSSKRNQGFIKSWWIKGIIALAVLYLFSNALADIAKHLGWLRDSTKIISRDELREAPKIEIKDKDRKEIKEEFGEETEIISKHQIPVVQPAPGLLLEQYGYITKKIDQEGYDLKIKYNVKPIVGFRFNPMFTVGTDFKGVYPGLGSTVFQFYRLELSGHVTTKYIGIGASWILRKETGLGLTYGPYYDNLKPRIFLFAKVAI